MLGQRCSWPDLGARIAIGEDVRTFLHYYDDRDVRIFRAEPGTEYALSLDYQTGQRLGDTAGTVQQRWR